jgi:DNA-binding transcriptional LysR family regulator
MPWDERIGRRLKLRDLYVLKTVAQLGSMGKAATQLAVSQPAISQAITDLERMLGVRLLDRSRHGVEPTPSGKAFLKWSAVIFDNLKQGVEEIDYLADPTAGEVRVGTIEIMIAGLVPHIISRLSRQYPRLTFTVMQAATRAMMQRDLRERSVDCIFGRMVMPNTEGDLDVEFLYEDPLVAVVGAGSKWLRRRNIAATELLDEPWCLPPFDWYAEAAGSVIPEAFRARGLAVPRHTVKSNSGNLFFSLVATGRFISALPASIIHLNGRRLGIKGLPFEFPIRPDPICIATLKGRSINPASQLFIECARELSKPFAKGAAVR